MWDLPGSGIKPMSPALQGRVLTPGPPRSRILTIWKYAIQWHYAHARHLATITALQFQNFFIQKGKPRIWYQSLPILLFPSGGQSWICLGVLFGCLFCCDVALGILVPQSGIEPSLQGKHRVLTTGPQGNSPNLLSVSLSFCLFWIFHRNRITPYVTFCVWLLLPSMMLLRLIQVVVCVSDLFFSKGVSFVICGWRTSWILSGQGSNRCWEYKLYDLMFSYIPSESLSLLICKMGLAHPS